MTSYTQIFNAASILLWKVRGFTPSYNDSYGNSAPRITKEFRGHESQIGHMSYLAELYDVLRSLKVFHSGETTALKVSASAFMVSRWQRSIMLPQIIYDYLKAEKVSRGHHKEVEALRPPDLEAPRATRSPVCSSERTGQPQPTPRECKEVRIRQRSKFQRKNQRDPEPAPLNLQGGVRGAISAIGNSLTRGFAVGSVDSRLVAEEATRAGVDGVDGGGGGDVELQVVLGIEVEVQEILSSREVSSPKLNSRFHGTRA
ncbi:hypothetical protein BDZ45DRAFT_751975 [Acephala macrosclerotiorum]|nr:hypothetical protein BDZ45DRAFT_751975 [Acephala macrosclerotiorum]